MTRFEELMNKILNGEKVTDWEPRSNMEKDLLACINGTGLEGLHAPITRADELLQALAVKIQNDAENGTGGGSSSGSGGATGTSAKIIVPGSTPVPNSGYVEKLYFNTNLTTDEVHSILKNAELSYVNYQDSPAYFLIADVANTKSIVIGDFAPLAGVESGQFYIIMDMATGVFMYISPALVDMMEAPFGGWNPELVNNNSTYDINAEAASEFLNPSDGTTYNVGLQNGKLFNLISASEFSDDKTIELSGEYDGMPLDVIIENQTINMQTLIEEKKIPSKITIDIENTLKNLLDARKSTCYLFYEYGETSVDDLIKYDDTENVTNMSHMFAYCKALKTIPLLNTSKVNDMEAMFAQCMDLTEIPDMDTSNVTDMSDMFIWCESLETIPLLNTSKVTNMSGMFNQGGLTSLPLLDTSNVTNMENMFCDNVRLQTIPLLSTSKVTNMSRMFYNCTSLESIPLLDTSNVTDMSDMFYDCRLLESIPLLDTSNVTNMEHMFYGNTRLQTIPQLDTSNVTNMSGMFGNCINLTTIEGLNMINVTNAVNMFYECDRLANLTLYNIKANLDIGFYRNYGTNLTVDSLIHTIKELINVGSTKTLQMADASLAKLENVYVRLLDDDGSGKLPCEVCESTDEGAMLITTYATNKGWTLA